jgi:hypothetical protein
VVIFRNSDARSDYPFRQHFSAATFRREASLCEQSDLQKLIVVMVADNARRKFVVVGAVTASSSVLRRVRANLNSGQSGGRP